MARTKAERLRKANRQHPSVPRSYRLRNRHYTPKKKRYGIPKG